MKPPHGGEAVEFDVDEFDGRVVDLGRSPPLGGGGGGGSGDGRRRRTSSWRAILLRCVRVWRVDSWCLCVFFFCQGFCSTSWVALASAVIAVSENEMNCNDIFLLVFYPLSVGVRASAAWRVCDRSLDSTCGRWRCFE